VILIFAGCADLGTESPTGPEQSISFSKDIQPIFNDNCAFSGCHSGANPRQGMSLETGKSYKNIVNVPSKDVPSVMRVKPSDPENSYLYRKIEGEQSKVGGSGEQMPLGEAPLSDKEIRIIEKWIAEGAKEN
jgi:hypothetical protein